MSRWFLFFKLFLAIYLIHSVQNSYANERQFHTLTLKNGLDVVIISDDEVDRSAAALSVGVGHIFDPDEKMGLAHYLEHMLFLGTEKYPNVSAYKKYLNENSGSSNAYTGQEITNYFFQSSHSAYEGAIDRFSQFFISPSFDKKYAEREVNAVDSEFEKNLLQDGWRMNHLIDQIAEEGHPVRKFGIGSKETLAGDNRPALLDFFQKYYVARNMKLALISKLSVQDMEKLVKKYFEAIPDRPFSIPEISRDYRKPLKGKFRFLKVKTIKDMRRLSLSFPTIRLHSHLDSKPSSIVGSVIGYEGKGSLLSKLKEEGLVLGLSAGGGYSHPNLSSFDITVNLTKKGEDEYERVLSMIFSYLEMLKKTGFREYSFKESQAMAKIDYEWKNPSEGMGFVASQSAIMQKYPLSDVETSPYLIKKYKPEAYREILDTLRPENMLVVLSNQKVKTDKKEKFFGTEYSYQEVGGALFESMKSPPVINDMSYPEKNDFIPYNLVLDDETPVLIHDDENAKVWFQYDTRFKQPKVYMKFLLETPKAYDTPDKFARSKLYESAFHEGLNELTYPISLAGLSYAMGIEKKGLTLTVGGYSERTSDLLKLVVSSLSEITISEQKFSDIKEAMVRSIKNRKLGQAYSRAAYFNRQLWMVHHFNEEDVIASLKAQSLDSIRQYAKELFEKVYVTGVVHGNWTPKKAEESVEVLLNALGSQPLPKNERYVDKLEELRGSETVLFSKQVEDNNNALYYGLQLGEYSYSRHAKASLAASIIQEDFYTQMRTNQQLGYIVWSFNNRVEDRMFFKMIIQSADYSPFELKKRVDSWMVKSKTLFGSLSNEDFEKHRQSLIVSLEKKADSISGVAGELYYLATEEKGNFKHKKELIEVVKKIKKVDVQAMGAEIFQSQETPRLVVLIRSKNNSEKIPENVLTTVDAFKSR